MNNKAIWMAFVIVIATFWIFPNTNSSLNGYPVASFSFEINGYNVTFNASSSYDEDGIIVNYTWDFGDGSIGYGEKTQHEYAEEGIYGVCLIVVDNDDKSNSTCNNVTIDLTPPTTSYNLIPLPNGKNGWCISNIIVQIVANDSISGVKNTYYKIDGNWVSYSNPILIEEDGIYEIKFYSIDNSNNVEDTKIVEISLQPTDNLSGIYKLYYRLDGGTYKEYENNITVGEGRHLLEYFAIDIAGNAEKLKRQDIKVDVTPPEAILSPSKGIYLFGRKIVSSDATTIIGNVTIKVEGQDNLSGINKVEFYIDGNLKAEDNSTPYEWQWEEFAIGKHEIKTIVYDAAGNRAILSEEVFIFNPKWG